MIHEDDSATRRATASDVAKAAGVSKWTVTRAFTPGASIAPDSRERVMQAARALDYRPSLLARSLATNKTNQVAVLVDDFANPSKLPFLAQLTHALQAEGMVMVLVNINQHYTHLNALTNVDQRQVDAAILFGTDFKDMKLDEAGARRPALPLYVLARDSMIDTIPSVSCDSAVAMAEICAHLWQRGYRRPGFMTGPRTLSTALGRRRHFVAEWAARGVTDVPLLVTGSYDREAAIATLRDYLNQTPPEARVDVLMCENDALAMGAADLARSHFGLRVPQDLAILGFDDYEQVAAPCYDLTSYRQPIAGMVDALIAMIQGKAPQQSLALRGELILRGST